MISGEEVPENEKGGRMAGDGDRHEVGDKNYVSVFIPAGKKCLLKWLDFFVRYFQVLAKRFCLLVILPCVLQLYVYAVGEFGMLFSQGDSDLHASNGIGVLARYGSIYDIHDRIMPKIWILFILVSIVLFFIKIWRDRVMAFLIITPMSVFILAAVMLHKLDDDIFRELSLINFEANECRFMERLRNIPGQYDDENIQREKMWFRRFTAVEQQYAHNKLEGIPPPHPWPGSHLWPATPRPDEDFSVKGKLVVWDYGDVHGERVLTVYDESGEIADPHTQQRYIGRVCSTPDAPSRVPRPPLPLGSYTCVLNGDYGPPGMMGGRPYRVVRLKSHFYSVTIGDTSIPSSPM